MQAFGKRPDLYAALGLCGLALAIRLAFFTRVPVLITKDSLEYFEPAFNLVNGFGFDLALRRPPVYSLFAAGVMKVLGQNLAAITFVQHLLGTLTVALAYTLGRLTFGRTAGLFAAVLVALDSVLVVYEHYILSESLFTPLLLGAGLLFVNALRRDRPAWYLLAGLALGVAVLARPIAQAALLAVPLAVLARRSSLSATWRPTLLVLGAAALLVVPWMARNKLSYGSFSTSGSGRFLSARVVKHDRGYVFYDPASATQYDSLNLRARQIFQSEAEARPEEGPIYSRYRSELGLSEAQADELLRQISLEGIARQPSHYVQTTATMFLDLFAGDQKEELLRWHLREHGQERVMNQWDNMRHLLGPPTTAQLDEAAAAESVASIYRPSRWLTPLVIGILLAVAYAVFRPADSQRGAVVFLAAIVGIVLLLCAALVGEVPRYRYPLDPLIAVLAGGGYLWALPRLVQLGFGHRSWRMGIGRMGVGKSTPRMEPPFGI
jgi:4-amino-4-deoxy-L-arabinose transferase-like glycosyltransferase